MPGDLLFCEFRLLDVIQNHQRWMAEEVGKFSATDLAVDNKDLCDQLEEKYRFGVPKLDVERTQAERKEIDVRGEDVFGDLIYSKASEITYFVPFQGDEEIFRYQPSQHTFNPPRGSVVDGELHLIYVRQDNDGVKAKADFDRDLQEIQKWLNWAEATVSAFNSSIRADALTLIAKRRNQLNSYKAMEQSLGYPIRGRSDVPEIYRQPVVRQRVIQEPCKPSPLTRGDTPKQEPFLEEATYKRILDLISQMATVIERSPQAFRTMGEEDIRFVLLVPLNTHYEGQASAEAFNFEGKTDILIKAEGKNIFIAECKFWRGPQSLRDALDQLLGYASWRDTKTALLIFNRQKNLTNVLGQIPQTMREHPNFRREDKYPSETGFRFVMHHRDDKSRELVVTVLVFEVPS